MQRLEHLYCVLDNISRIQTAKTVLYIFFTVVAFSFYNGRIKIGFDSCQSPAASLHLKQIAPECIEYCEAARFSMYISSEMVAYPCSFGIDSQQFSFDLKGHTIQEAWNSLQFNEFKKKQKARCALCSSICHDCALDIGVNICAKKQNKN